MFAPTPRLTGRRALIGSFAVFVCLGWSIPSFAQPNKDEKKNSQSNSTNGHRELVTPGPVHTLGECIRIASEKSPLLAAKRASLESAQAGQAGIDKASRIMHSLIAPDLKYRKQQASAGVAAAEAELMQTEYDVTYNVIRNYYTAVYAREQFRVTYDLVTQLNSYLDFVKDAIKEGGLRGIDIRTQDRLQMYVGQGAMRKAEAENGYRRALRALAHEMGVGPDYLFDVADRTLPEVKAENITREVVIGHAVSRRGEITLACVGAEVLRLEVDAQGVIRCRLRSFTAAAGSDVHSHIVPQGSREGEYRPDAIPPEYPALLVGPRSNRVARAEALSMRAEAVYEKTRDLVTLEAENGFYRWEESSQKVVALKDAATGGRDLRDRNRKDGNGKFTDEKLIADEALIARTLADYNEALYSQLVNLAALERITAGGIRVNFPGR